jgi:zinc transport system substrate-binding protein
MKFKYLFLILVLFAVGCTNKVEVAEDNTFNIVTSFYPIYIFTENVVKDIPGVSVTNMTQNHVGCIHDYSLTTTDMKLISRADAFIINGVGLESFLEKAYETKNDLEVIDSSKGIEILKENFSDGDNEHIWLSISNAISQVRNICDSLVKLDEKNADRYIENTNAYVERLENLRNELREELYGCTDVKMITSHDAFSYLAGDFGFEIVAVIEKEEGVSPTSKEIQEILDIIKEYEIKNIFIEEDTSTKIIDTISNESGAKVIILDTITSGSGDSLDYENRMRKNIKAIKESL